MAKPNYKFQKRQKELDRKKKKEEKLLSKRENVTAESEEAPAPVADEVASPEQI